MTVTAAPEWVDASEIFSDGFEAGTTCGIWSVTVTPESCTATDSDCDGLIDEEVPWCFSVPYQAPPFPLTSQVETSSGVAVVDVYIVMDRSGSMAQEADAIRDNLTTVANNVTCPPSGIGTPPDCIENVWWGVGSIGYAGVFGESYTNHLDLQLEPALVGPAIPSTEPLGGFDETALLAIWSTVTGGGSQQSGCTISTDYPERVTCSGSPAGTGGSGYPCFRPNATRVAVVATDEAPTETFNCPNIWSVADAATTAGVRLIGLVGSGATPATTTDLGQLAVGSGAVDSVGNPLVFTGADAGAPAALQDALLTLAGDTTMDVTAVVIDEPGDGVDTQMAFVERIETLQLGTPSCPSGLTERDDNSDGHPDTYVEVLTDQPLCFALVLRSNVSVSLQDPGVFPASIDVTGNSAIIESIPIKFAVPPSDP
jgi:hypothetical protein